MAKGDRIDENGPRTETSQLAVWKAQHAALGRLIESYEEALRLGALGGTSIDPAAFNATSTGLPGLVGLGGVGSGITNMIPVELPTGAFLGLSIPEAIKFYLSAAKQKKTAREIATALKEGGMETTAANWETTVTGALHRLKAAGILLRFKDGWGLAEFYPESLRARIANEKPKRGRPRKKKAISPKNDGPRAIKLREDAPEERAS